MHNSSSSSARYYQNVDSPIALGCWAFGGDQWGSQSDSDSNEVMEAALASGVRHFDTAAAYGGGRSEQVIGEFLQGRDEDVVLATKGNVWDGRAQSLVESLEGSLKNLKVDHVDLYYLHWPNSTCDMRPIIEAMEAEREKGRFSALGVSNFSVEQLEQVKDSGRVDALQIGYSALWREAEVDLLPYCLANGISVVSYSSLAQGILTGKFPEHPTFPEGDDRPSTTLFSPEAWPMIYRGVEKMKHLAEEAERPLAHLATQWVAAQSAVDLVLLGARNRRQMEENSAALADPIAPEILARFTALSDEIAGEMPRTGNIFNYHP